MPVILNQVNVNFKLLTHVDPNYKFQISKCNSILSSSSSGCSDFPFTPVQKDLMGTNFGGWLNLEGWMFDGGRSYFLS